MSPWKLPRVSQGRCQSRRRPPGSAGSHRPLTRKCGSNTCISGSGPGVVDSGPSPWPEAPRNATAVGLSVVRLGATAVCHCCRQSSPNHRAGLLHCSRPASPMRVSVCRDWRSPLPASVSPCSPCRRVPCGPCRQRLTVVSVNPCCLRHASMGVPREAGPEHALGRQLYALRRWSSTNTYKLSGSATTALEGRLLHS